MKFSPQKPVCLFIFALMLLGAVRPGRCAEAASKDGRIQIRLPDGYSEKPPARPPIKIEAVDDAAATTLLVLSENQQGLPALPRYAETVRDQMTAKLRDAESDAGAPLQIKGHPAIRYEITGISANGQRVAFLVTVIQTETRFNQVIGSCQRADFAAHKEEFASIAATLAERPGK